MQSRTGIGPSRGGASTKKPTQLGDNQKELLVRVVTADQAAEAKRFSQLLDAFHKRFKAYDTNVVGGAISDIAGNFRVGPLSYFEAEKDWETANDALEFTQKDYAEKVLAGGRFLAIRANISKSADQTAFDKDWAEVEASLNVILPNLMANKKYLPESRVRK